MLPMLCQAVSSMGMSNCLATASPREFFMSSVLWASMRLGILYRLLFVTTLRQRAPQGFDEEEEDACC